MENKEAFLNALELEKGGDWDGAHKIVQEYSEQDACWIHAYLHRKEGDLGNAQYWYHRCGKEMHPGSLDEEWQIIHDSLK